MARTVYYTGGAVVAAAMLIVGLFVLRDGQTLPTLPIADDHARAAIPTPASRADSSPEPATLATESTKAEPSRTGSNAREVGSARPSGSVRLALKLPSGEAPDGGLVNAIGTQAHEWEWTAGAQTPRLAE